MDAPMLTDQTIYPDDEVLASVLGKAKIVWDELKAMLACRQPAAAAEWRYYNDGKRWLCKVTQKKKTLCWISAGQGCFRTTFYFSDKAEGVIARSPLSDAIKMEWLRRERVGKLRPITIPVKKRADLKTIQTLLTIKEQIK